MTTSIKNDEDFEHRLDQLKRFYRALREAWIQVNATDEAEVVKWVKAGGGVIETLDSVQAEIEAHTGAAELRVIWDQLKAKQQEKLGKVERA